MKIYSVLSILLLMVSETALSCACCSSDHTLFERKGVLENARFEGNMGVYIYGEMGQPDIDNGQGQVSGSIVNGQVQLNISRAEKVLGRLTLKPEGSLIHKGTGFDFFLNEKAIRQLDSHVGVPVYHELSTHVNVVADQALSDALGVTFSALGKLTFHAVGNSCWHNAIAGNYWAFRYAVKKGQVVVRGLARGVITPPAD
jgi:hypothetical protein